MSSIVIHINTRFAFSHLRYVSPSKMIFRLIFLPSSLPYSLSSSSMVFDERLLMAFRLWIRSLRVLSCSFKFSLSSSWLKLVIFSERSSSLLTSLFDLVRAWVIFFSAVSFLLTSCPDLPLRMSSMFCFFKKC